MLTFYFPVNSTSLGASAWKILENVKEEFALVPIGGGIDATSFEPVSNELKEKINRALDLGAKKIDTKGKSIKLWHAFAGLEKVTAKQDLYTFHELDSLTEVELHSLNQQERVMVPCNYNKSVFEKCGVTCPVDVIPLGVDREIFKPHEKYANKTGPFVFTMAGKFEARKLHMETLQAFNNLFANNPNIKLRACITNRFVNMDEVFKMINERVFQGRPPNNIEFINWLPTDRHFADFLAHSDCFISPSRGESFNLPLIQAMSCGVPVITNAEHAHADYITPENATIIKSHRMVPAFDNMFFRNDGRTNTGQWFDFQVNDLAQAMISVFQKGRKVNEAGIETAKRFTWQTTADKIVELHTK